MSQIVDTIWNSLRWLRNILCHKSLFLKHSISSEDASPETVAKHSVAIFQFEWPLQSHTINLAKQFARKGVLVDVFLKDCTPELVELSECAHCNNIIIHKISAGILEILITKALFYYSLIFVPPSVILNKYIDIVIKHSYKHKHHLYIGVEKKGLIWASRIAKKTNTPVAYYSLELYDDDHPFFVGNRFFQFLRQEEMKYHRKTSFTIIQDNARGEALERQNKTKCDFVYLPVSTPRTSTLETHFLHDLLKIPYPRKIILYFGVFFKSRFSLEIAHISQNISNDNVIVFHGYGMQSLTHELVTKSQDPVNNLILSLSLVHSTDIPKIIASAHIGLIFYDDKCDNDRLTAYSSEKLSLFLQAGKPIITFNKGNFYTLFSRFQCGIMINDIDELPSAILRIENDYDTYSHAATQAYNAIYDYEMNFDLFFPKIFNQPSNYLSGKNL